MIAVWTTGVYGWPSVGYGFCVCELCEACGSGPNCISVGIRRASERELLELARSARAKKDAFEAMLKIIVAWVRNIDEFQIPR